MSASQAYRVRMALAKWERAEKRLKNKRRLHYVAIVITLALVFFSIGAAVVYAKPISKGISGWQHSHYSSNLQRGNLW